MIYIGMQTYEVTLTKGNGRTVAIEVEADTVLNATRQALVDFQWRYGYTPSKRGMVISPKGA